MDLGQLDEGHWGPASAVQPFSSLAGGANKGGGPSLVTVRGKSGQGSPGVRHGLLRGAVRLEMETQPTVKDGRAKTSDADRDGAQVGRSPWVECLCVAGGTHLGHNPE